MKAVDGNDITTVQKKHLSDPSRYKSDLTIPEEFPALIKDFAKNVLKYQPDDIYAFGVDYFREKIAIRDGKPIPEKICKVVEPYSAPKNPNDPSNAKLEEEKNKEHKKENKEAEDIVLEEAVNEQTLSARSIPANDENYSNNHKDNDGGKRNLLK
jgi:hypothetical protein